MEFQLTHGRATRMIQALLVATDPFGRVQRGALPSAYDALAVSVEAALREGADARRLVLLLEDHAAAHDDDGELDRAPAIGFARASRDWWHNAAARDAVAVAV